MNWKSLGLATTSLAVVCIAATTASAAPPLMGTAYFGFAVDWQHPDFFFAGKEWQVARDFTDLSGGFRLNLPYSDTTNIQLDADGTFAFLAGEHRTTYAGGTGVGAHIDYRDKDGLLGVFVAAGRGITFDDESPLYFAFGAEGQWYCDRWTLGAQIGYLDSGDYGGGDPIDTFHKVGFARATVARYINPRFKLFGDIAYADGDDEDSNARLWAWGAGGEYFFAQSMPAAVFFEYRGISSENTGLDFKLLQNTVRIGLKFHIGATDSLDADRHGASEDLPDFARWVNAGGQAIEE